MNRITTERIRGGAANPEQGSAATTPLINTKKRILWKIGCVLMPASLIDRLQNPMGENIFSKE